MRPVPPADRRRSQRTPATTSIGLLVESEDFKVEHNAFTIDLSLYGAKVRSPSALLAGETVGIITKGDLRHTISARVVWAQRGGAYLWCLAGLEYLEPSPS